jgi:hypothetical protein
MPEIVTDLEKAVMRIERRTTGYNTCYDPTFTDNN